MIQTFFDLEKGDIIDTISIAIIITKSDINKHESHKKICTPPYMPFLIHMLNAFPSAYFLTSPMPANNTYLLLYYFLFV